jgi:hypothetical protein
MATAALPQDPDLGQLRNQARELQRAVRGGEPTALARVARWHPAPPPEADRFPLTAAQLVLAANTASQSLESPSKMLRVLLARAVTHDQRDRVALLAGHGVDVVSRFTEGRAPKRYTPIELALLGRPPRARDQLRELGARPPRLRPADAFVAAVLAADADVVHQTPPEVVAEVRRKRTGLVTWAAAEGAPGAPGDAQQP